MGIQVRKVPVNLKLEGEAAPSDSAAVHYARSSQCNKSMHGIKVVTVQLNTRPQHIGDGVAGAGIQPRRRCHDIGCDITKSMISYGYDILSY